ncbi:hypothetical protein C8J56DRAFT_954738 [Mycena floridula]|nr:hypothetical protein C8J56DRAFT_954738 [Mycena floridula]
MSNSLLVLMFLAGLLVYCVELSIQQLQDIGGMCSACILLTQIRALLLLQADLVPSDTDIWAIKGFFLQAKVKLAFLSILTLLVDNPLSNLEGYDGRSQSVAYPRSSVLSASSMLPSTPTLSSPPAPADQSFKPTPLTKPSSRFMNQSLLPLLSPLLPLVWC